MRLVLSVEDLDRRDACTKGINAFRTVFGGDKASLEWTCEKQIELLRGPLSKYLGWAFSQGIIPWWSMSRADLSGADLSRADLSRADLPGADLSRADLSASQDPVLAPFGWQVKDGVAVRLSAKEEVTP